MPLRTQCPRCRRAVSIPDQFLGQRVTCPCGEELTAGVPATTLVTGQDPVDRAVPRGPRRRRTMRLKCPHCRGRVEVSAAIEEGVECPRCGEGFAVPTALPADPHPLYVHPGLLVFLLLVLIGAAVLILSNP